MSLGVHNHANTLSHAQAVPPVDALVLHLVHDHPRDGNPKATHLGRHIAAKVSLLQFIGERIEGRALITDFDLQLVIRKLENDFDRLLLIKLVTVPKNVGHHLLKSQQDVVASPFWIFVEDDGVEQSLTCLPDEAEMVHRTKKFDGGLCKHGQLAGAHGLSAARPHLLNLHNRDSESRQDTGATKSRIKLTVAPGCGTR